MRRSFLLALKIIFSLILAGGFLLYVYHQSRAVLAGPDITIDSPKDKDVLDTALVLISGHSSHANAVFVNGRQIFTDTNGAFAEELLLLYGYNIIEVKATDQQGRQVTKTLTLVYK